MGQQVNRSSKDKILAKATGFTKVVGKLLLLDPKPDDIINKINKNKNKKKKGVILR